MIQSLYLIHAVEATKLAAVKAEMLKLGAPTRPRCRLLGDHYMAPLRGFAISLPPQRTLG